MSQRRLAAIMFTDIVGYTAMMGSDEDKAFEVLRKNREIHAKYIEQFQGTLIKEMGDGMLISFDLASEAVRCAIEIQKACKSENIPLKIGIHEGEMVFEGNDVLGDGVNIASRIQDGAEEGCILISGSVYRDIKNKADIKAEFIGEQLFKNVDEKIKIYRVNCGERTEDNSNEKKQITKKYKRLKSKKQKSVFGILGLFVIIMIAVLVWLFGRISSPPSPRASEGDEKSIAVRPFWNENNNEENDAFVNGMTEDIRINLAKIADLRVLSRGSVEKYRDSEYSGAEIAKEQDVSYILEGTVQRIGNQVKVQVQLIFGENDDHIWQDTYRIDISDATQIFDLQSEIAKSIAARLHAEITPVERERLETRPTKDLKAYEKFIEGREHLNAFWRKVDRRDAEMAHKLFHESLKIDSNFVWGYTGLADVWGFTGLSQLFRSDYIFTDSLKYYADRVIELDPNSARGYGFLGSYYKQIGDFQQSIAFFEKSVHLDPNFCWPMEELGYIYCYNYNDYITGIPYLFKGFELRKAQQLDIELLDRKLGLFYLQIGAYEKSKHYLISDVRNNSNCLSLLYYNFILGGIQQKHERSLRALDSICALMPSCNFACISQKMKFAFITDQFDEAEELMNQILNAGGNFSKLDSLNLAYMHQERGNTEKATGILEKMEKPILYEIQISRNKWTPFFFLSIIKAMRNEKTEALKYLREMERLGFRDGWHDNIVIYPGYKNMWDDPEFQAIVKQEQHKKAAIRAYLKDLESRGEINL